LAINRQTHLMSQIMVKTAESGEVFGFIVTTKTDRPNVVNLDPLCVLTPLAVCADMRATAAIT
jgi:hypothetical protein